MGGSAPPDPQFNYVTMLLHGDGTNGAQNNTFLDSSSNNFTITRNGNTTQGTFSPYGSNWSANLPATVLSGLQFDRLGTTSSFNFMHNASALWTLELWVNLSALPASSFPIFSNNDITSSGVGVTVSINSSGQVFLFVTNGTSGSPVCSNTFTTTAIATNSWTHIALVYNQSLSSGNALLFINGVASGSANKTGNSPSASNASLAAELFSYATGGSSYAFNGYASNLRITNSAVYSAAFTPSTTPLTAIANTQLLTFQSNRFVDNSTNAYAIVPRTSQSIQRFNPFGASTAYSTSVIGGSGYFDGSGDYLTATGSSNLAFGAGDFTIELWVYFNSVTSPPAYQFIYSSADSSVFANTPVIYWYETSSSLRFNNGGDVFSIAGIQAKTWYHVAICRSGSTTKMFLNGAQVGSATDTTTYINQPSRPMIGANGNGSGNLPFNGYISDVRCLKGTALYTSSFTPPTAPLTAISNTQLLLNMTNGAIFDNAMMSDLETVGNAQISTSVVKYGTGSMYFDGNGDYLAGPYSPNLDFGTGDFTVELWMYWSGSVSDAGFIGSKTSGGMDFAFTSSSLRIGRINTAWDSTFSWSPSPNTWYHIAFTRSSGTARAFVNGTQVGSSLSNTNNYYPNGGVYVGVSAPPDRYTNGYIDDLRITKGYARYTANFTPPTQAFPNTGPN